VVFESVYGQYRADALWLNLIDSVADQALKATNQSTAHHRRRGGIRLSVAVATVEITADDRLQGCVAGTPKLSARHSLESHAC
jgi:hypothetical protein